MEDIGKEKNNRDGREGKEKEKEESRKGRKREGAGGEGALQGEGGRRPVRDYG